MSWSTRLYINWQIVPNLRYSNTESMTSKLSFHSCNGYLRNGRRTKSIFCWSFRSHNWRQVQWRRSQLNLVSQQCDFESQSTFRWAVNEVVAAAVWHHNVRLLWGQYGRRYSVGTAVSTPLGLGHHTEVSCNSPVLIVWDCRLAFAPCFDQAQPRCDGLLTHGSYETRSRTIPGYWKWGDCRGPRQVSLSYM